MNTCHYFADTQEEAQAIYVKLKEMGYVVGYRPWSWDDLCYMGVLDRQEITSRDCDFQERVTAMQVSFRKSIDRSLDSGITVDE